VVIVTHLPRRTAANKAAIAFGPEQLDKLLVKREVANMRNGMLGFVDSGAINHVTGIKKYFTTYTATQGQQIEIAD
jgi:hypothetical protein